MLILMELTLYYFDFICACNKSTNQKLAGVQDLEGLIPDWAEKVASEAQLKPSVPLSTCTSKTPQIVEFDADLDDDEYYELLATQGGKDLVHLVEKPRNTSKGLKCPLPVLKEPEYAEQDEFELLNDSEAAGDAEEQYDGDMEMVDDDGCADQKSLKAEAIMSVDISDSKIASKLVKTEDTISHNPRTKIKKGQAKNADLLGAWPQLICCAPYPKDFRRLATLVESAGGLPEERGKRPEEHGRVPEECRKCSGEFPLQGNTSTGKQDGRIGGLEDRRSGGQDV
ncbi:uncharacterized protein BJ212DRAFT_1487518 [Suillus subaureus]|uniref:Uncharacterized protein n=1 Tax=Suillus subaureus TaxID=48587 RepID=A0A9P7J4C0_9AGAM|nr:uncharacterized protein BJ212DRAFT_1487518 [Suillus subaureus]KAG1801895.1 hypothetical protein BJ212DRAFT_1487518 [Suillus subaureus]